MAEPAMQILVYTPGSVVTVLGEGLDCTVSCVHIDFGNQIYYELTYWLNGELKVVKLHSSHIGITDGYQGTIVGFAHE